LYSREVSIANALTSSIAFNSSSGLSHKIASASLGIAFLFEPPLIKLT